MSCSEFSLFGFHYSDYSSTDLIYVSEVILMPSLFSGIPTSKLLSNSLNIFRYILRFQYTLWLLNTYSQFKIMKICCTFSSYVTIYKYSFFPVIMIESTFLVTANDPSMTPSLLILSFLEQSLNLLWVTVLEKFCIRWWRTTIHAWLEHVSSEITHCLF
jgi:hypothetical protein